MVEVGGENDAEIRNDSGSGSVCASVKIAARLDWRKDTSEVGVPTRYGIKTFSL